MARVIVIDDRETVAELIVNTLQHRKLVEFCVRAPQKEDGFAGHLSGGLATMLKEHEIDTVVYSPPPRRHHDTIIDLEDAESVFQLCARAGIKKFVLLSSAMIYGASPHNQGFISESQVISRSDKKRITKDWLDLETLAVAYLGELSGTGIELIILRPAAILVVGGDDYFSDLFRRSLACVLPGHDPTIQLLSPIDLASAICSAVGNRAGGVFNVAPDGVITLRAALRLSEAIRLPMSRMVQRFVRRALAHLGLTQPIEQLDYIRYSWTISNRKAKRELKWEPCRSSVEALRDFRIAQAGHLKSHQLPSLEFDDYGMDKRYIELYGRRMFKFLHDYYWRVEVKDVHYVPREGRAVLVGVHRGFMPWDAVMALHLIVRNVGRYVRFLIHPGLIKFPFLFNFHTKLGGIIACQENADFVLKRDEIVGIFPEGIKGAFLLYRDAYKLTKFGRDEFVKIALRHRAPIVPFVTVGSAEIFPIIKKVNWAWWKRNTEWPTFPITPTWPFVGAIPLPSKWHTQFLEPLHIEDRYPPEAADDPEVVSAISQEVRSRMEEAIGDMLRRRQSIFFGSIFEEEPSRRRLAERAVFQESIGYKEKLS
ncbi:MAG TPA: 1-acyl-sn-glycerol-3-phosphate acyltransferase [Pyrinomonadaceae bacterium]|nr:1-acyl-sn-glycerol-3-phosphate acyltransferase [Pyrinomonadaceae bacterium]